MTVNNIQMRGFVKNFFVRFWSFQVFKFSSFQVFKLPRCAASLSAMQNPRNPRDPCAKIE
jgi:hypothetical protein